jgi:hypothetical protein
VECWVNDTCIFVGDPKNTNGYQDITLIGPRGRATVKNGQKPVRWQLGLNDRQEHSLQWNSSLSQIVS